MKTFFVAIQINMKAHESKTKWHDNLSKPPRYYWRNVDGILHLYFYKIPTA